MPRLRSIAACALLLFASTGRAALPLSSTGLPAIDSSSTAVVVVEPVRAPTTISFSDRGSDRIRLTWNDRTGSETSNRILRRGVGGGWQVVKTYGALSGQISFLNSGLAQDTFYCYRIEVANSTGSAISSEYCVFTRGTEPRPLVRLQLEVETGDVADAGTDDPVRVQLNTGKFLLAPADNLTWLNYGQDDFRRGTTFVYDLRPPGDLNDVTQLTLEKFGSDGLCLRRLRLIANAGDARPGLVVFERDFRTATAECQWIDGDDGHQPRLGYLHGDLRGQALWPTPTQYWFCGDSTGCAVSQIPLYHETLEHRIEGYAGHVFHDLNYAGVGMRWDGALPIGVSEWVQVDRVDDRRARVTLHAEIDVPYYFNPDVRISAELVVRPQFQEDGTGAAAIAVEEVGIDISADLIAELLSSLPCYVPGAGAVMLWEMGECSILDIVGDLFADVVRTSLPPFELPPTDAGCAVPVVGVDEIGAFTANCSDFDGDGMANGWEIENGLDPDDDDDAAEDPDGDGRTNLQEHDAGTDPHCAWARGHENFCRDCGPCSLGEGDCDTNYQCFSGLVCNADVGARYGLPSTVDVCELAPPSLLDGVRTF